MRARRATVDNHTMRVYWSISSTYVRFFQSHSKNLLLYVLIYWEGSVYKMNFEKYHILKTLRVNSQNLPSKLTKGLMVGGKRVIP